MLPRLANDDHLISHIIGSQQVRAYSLRDRPQSSQRSPRGFR